MRVRLKVNLGSLDAAAHGLEHAKCQAGMEADVADAAGKWLIVQGHAESLEAVKGVAKAATVEAVPPETPKPKVKAKDGKERE